MITRAENLNASVIDGWAGRYINNIGEDGILDIPTFESRGDGDLRIFQKYDNGLKACQKNIS